MNEKSEKTVSFLTFEALQARSDRRNKRLVIALVIISALLFASNMAWLGTVVGRI